MSEAPFTQAPSTQAGQVIGRTTSESTPWWPEPLLPSAGTPNVVVVLLDDTGFAHLGCYGGLVDTPNYDRLAARGLRYTNFHTTALCSPTRACLLTGRNHHSVGMRALSNFDTGYPNMRGRIARSAGTMAEMLREEGFATWAVGKWHLTPMREASAVGPFGDWPLQRGFDRYYGFMQGETDQFHPELYEDNRLVDQPRTPEEGYHVTEDLVDRSIDLIRTQHTMVPERPFFLYLAFGATHAPHQAPDAYLEKWRGRFDDGWDVARQRVYSNQLAMGVIPPNTDLAPRNPGVEPWDDLSADEQALACRLQEAFAAMLDHADTQLGRLLDELESLDIADDTVVVALSDNGASQEGRASGILDTFRHFNGVDQPVDEAVARLDEIGTRTSNTNYPWGWAQVGNSPGKRYKQNTHSGGVRDPLIISWPGGIDPAANGQIRTQFHHVVDLVPTLLELLGVTAPESVNGVEQQPIEGTSLAYTFDPAADDATAVPSRKRRQYFEMQGHRAIWADGWKAVAFHQYGTELDDDVWELYHLDEDFSECHDLADAQPERLAAMVEMFWEEADDYGVLPIMDRAGNLSGPTGSGLFSGHATAGTPRNRDTFVYLPPTPRVPPDASPALGSRNWEATFHVERPAGDESGVLMAFGTVNNGLVAYVDDAGHLVYDHNAYAGHTVVRSPAPVPIGSSVLAVEQQRVKRGPGRARLLVDGDVVAEVAIPVVPVMISPIGLDLGRNPTGVSDAYVAPYEFSGRIARVEVDTTPAFRPDEEEAIEVAAAERMQ
ncbi:MAG: arylsulfatase [Acidimicrobiaceae bacterium]|nr:arylsulfatase [Acidimicrobiaceae bacterium]